MTTNEEVAAIARNELEQLVARLEDLAAVARRAVANSQGLADHKLLILANYGDLALQMAPTFRAYLTSHSENGSED